MSKTLDDEMLASGDLDSIDQALEGMELDDSLLFGEDDDDGHQEPEQTAVEDKQGESSVDGADDNQPEVIDTTGESHGDGDQEGEGEKPSATQGNIKEIDGQLYVAVDGSNSEVMGKDGKHKIPYEVLERARQGASGTKDLESKIQDLEGQLKTTSSKQELFQKQLEDAGINPDKLPDELLNDPKAIERIKEEYPGEAGQMIAALISRVQNGKQQQQPAQQGESTEHPVNAALSSDHLKELNGWRDGGDNDRWEMALVIDNKLNESPEFANLPIDQRFAEVQRRVKAAFGDPVQASVDKELAQQEQTKQQLKQPEPTQQPQTPIPNSPSSLGTGGQDTTQASHEALANQDALAMEQSMNNMSESQLEAFLEQAGMAFD